MSEKKEKEQIIFKIITIGDTNVGKTSIIRRFIYNVFEDESIGTIGVSFSFKEVILKNGQIIKLKIVDTAGQEKFKSVTKSYFKNTDGVLFVFDYNDEKSFENISEWVQIFEENINKDTISRFLIANKSDLEQRVSEDSINNFLNQHKNKYKFEKTSALENINIEKVFQELAEELYKIHLNTANKGQNKKIILKSNYQQKGNCICTF